MAAEKPGAGGPPVPIVIKKYANRRLYNTATSAYVTLDHLSEMVRAGVDFLVQDAKTGDDITRGVLTQIIFEQESRGQHLLPVQFLRRLIRFYGDNMQAFVPSYLEFSIERFSTVQDQWRDQMTKAWASPNPVVALEEQTRASLALFDQAMKLWSPFVAQATPTGAFVEGAPIPAAAPPQPRDENDPEALAEMKRQIEAMQKQLDQIVNTRKP